MDTSEPPNPVNQLIRVTISMWTHQIFNTPSQDQAQVHLFGETFHPAGRRTILSHIDLLGHQLTAFKKALWTPLKIQQRNLEKAKLFTRWRIIWMLTESTHSRFPYSRQPSAARQGRHMEEVQSVRSATTTIETEPLANAANRSQFPSQSEPEPQSEPESSSPGCRQPHESCRPHQIR